jgi:hypothetical protein
MVLETTGAAQEKRARVDRSRPIGSRPDTRRTVRQAVGHQIDY